MAADETSGNENERVNDPENDYPAADANNRTFLITASLLTGTLLLLSLFTVGYLLLDRAGGRAGEVAAIETQNADILATNDMITRTVQAMEADATSRAGELAVATDDAGATAAPEAEATSADAGATPAADETPVPDTVAPQDATATAALVEAATMAAATSESDPATATAVAEPSLEAPATDTAAPADETDPAAATATTRPSPARRRTRRPGRHGNRRSRPGG